MSPLNAFIEQLNIRRTLFEKPPITLPADAAEVQSALDSALSPENLRGDGEFSMEKVRRYRNFYTAAQAELTERLASNTPTGT